MTIAEGIAFGSLTIGFLGFIFKFSNDEAGKRSRIYQRIDEVKADMNDKYRNKEVCTILHEQIRQDFQEVKNSQKEMQADIKLLLKGNGIE